MKDPLAVGLGALASGAGIGGATLVAALFIVRLLERQTPAVSYEESAADPVLAGAFVGLAVAATFGWIRTRALDNVWQRGVIAIMGAMGALIVGFIAWPVDRWLGSSGLVVWGLVAFAVGAAASRWSVRGSKEDALKEGGG